MNIYVSSLGCDKNLCDTEHMLSLLSKAGYGFTDDESAADIIIVNSCCFIGDAQEESIEEILHLSRQKETGKCKALVVTGCLSERFQADFEQELPEVDGILGISSWDEIVPVVEEALQGRHPHVFKDHDRLCSTQGRILTTGGHYAYLKIAEGCDKYCTYCIIPYVRGAYRSIPMEDLLEEAQALASNGVRELILVAQETTLYGTDLYGRKALPELLEKLSAIEGLHWIRLLYCYPEEITDELIEAIASLPKVVPYLDIPIQHISDSVLKRMNRKTTKEALLGQIRTLREKIPGLTLRTTLITGFPGETEEEAAELLSFVKTAGFERLGVFPYSREDGTAAAKMKGQLSKKVKNARRDAIMKAQQQISLAHGKALVGKTLEVLVEGRLIDEDRVYVGRSVMDAPGVDGQVFFESKTELISGDFVNIRIKRAEAYDLYGVMV